MNLFGAPECELGDGTADAYATDEYGAAWFCRAHLGRFLILQMSIGRTLPAFLGEMR